MTLSNVVVRALSGAPAVTRRADPTRSSRPEQPAGVVGTGCGQRSKHFMLANEQLIINAVL